MSEQSGTRNFKYEDETPSNRIVNQDYPMSCVAACGVQILRDQGIEISEARMRELMQFDETWGIIMNSGGVQGMNEAIKATTLDGVLEFRAGALDTEDIPKVLRHAPFIANLAKHAVIVDEFDDSKLRLRDPWGIHGPGSGSGSEGTMSLTEFERLWRLGYHMVIFMRRLK